ncbi:MAG: hypothetical protein FIB04_04895 [Gammaproteobacteria bacterium]|nr:hypothetical protein [Gammaproteobacteria bacterium]
MTPVQLLGQWLASRLSGESAAWFDAGVARLRSGATDRDLFLLTSAVTRRLGMAPLGLQAADLEAAAASRAGWDPSDWTVDQAARVYLLLVSTPDGAETSRRLDRLCGAADIGELVAFHRGLPLYPDQPRHALRAAEGVRSNMRVVFEAVAHRNPYPSEQFAEQAWNQMVLKALFVGTRLDLVVGLDRRRNANLARMLCDYAHERWAASRPVSPELWRCVGPFAVGNVLDDFRRLLAGGDERERQAAALALLESPDAAGRRLIDGEPELAAAARDGRFTWDTLAESA